MAKDEKIVVEFSPKELAFVCEAFYNYTGRTPKKKVRILKKHRKFCDKLFTTLAYALADQYGVKANDAEYFE